MSVAIFASGGALAEGQVQLNITISTPEGAVEATLESTPAAQEFARRLPLSLTLNDYAGKEKVSDLPFDLPRKGSPDGFTPTIGDISYYAPWGNLAIFYQPFSYSQGLIKLGRIKGDLKKLGIGKPTLVTIQLAAGE